SRADIANIGYLPEERGLYKKMKVGQQALFFAGLKGLSRKVATMRLHQWFERLGIDSWWNRPVEELSKGMAQKVQFVITALHEPKLLIFDEPFSGFDPINANMLKEEIMRLRDNGATVIFSTHNMNSVEAVCDNLTLINASHNILSGPVNEIRTTRGQNRYRIVFSGEEKPLLSELTNMAKTTELNRLDNTTSELVIQLADTATRHDLLRAVTEKVELISFDTLLPSMDEIFISTIQKSNERQSTSVDNHKA
ncbi:MAG: DUF4162 domain-containing protein, partial [Muribaculaceae bacterium]|nr:DUF4162 domain-containing protein [Muribaculaceae bacterium]